MHCNIVAITYLQIVTKMVSKTLANIYLHIYIYVLISLETIGSACGQMAYVMNVEIMKRILRKHAMSAVGFGLGLITHL